MIASSSSGQIPYSPPISSQYEAYYAAINVSAFSAESFTCAEKQADVTNNKKSALCTLFL